MAYNLQSLITILEQILNPKQTRWILDHNKPHLEIEALLKKAVYLQQALDKSSLSKTESLESQIRDAAHKAEDIIESYMVDEMLSRPGGVSFIFSPPDLQQVTKELDSAMAQVMMLVEGKKMSSGSSSSGASFSSSKSVEVGVDEDLMQLKDRLTGMERKLEIIPIVGMGGIGKTTLARNLYQDPLIVEHFEFLAWTTISQDYNMKAILSTLLRYIIGKEFDDKHIGKKSDELKDILHKSLYGRRYVIVLDDIWSTQVWDEMRKYFPDNNNGSRIVITTREPDVAKYADSRSNLHQVQLLNESESWNLLRQIVFGEEDCSDHALQEIGAKIASDCGGLPLAINVIGGFLSKLERSKDVWKNIAKDVRAAISKTDEQCSNILSLSYNHLPNHLKPCFLYMGAFPEDYEIKASRLIRMWVGEGFVKSNGDKSLEEEAEDYLKALVKRNLFLVRHFNLNGKPKKRYYMHDLLRDVCMRKGDEEKFLQVVKNGPEVPFSSPARRLRVDTSYGMGNVYTSAYQFMSLVRSFIRTNHVDSHWKVNLPPSFFALRLLRVLDLEEMKLQDFPREIFELVNLRYLNVRCVSSIPTGISRLWNLQTLIVDSTFGGMPYEIWGMSELRHFKFNYTIWLEDGYIIKCVQEKLQTISLVKLTHSLIRSGFFEKIPNIKKLEITCEKYPSTAVDLSHLHNLQTFTCSSCWYGGDGSYFLSALTFPRNLSKLTLHGCTISASVLTDLSALLKLETLSIWNCYFGSEWEAGEGDEFRSLQFLSLAGSNLVRWRGDETNFPRLRHLRLKDCWDLEEIPSDFGEIPTLQLIEVENCSASVVDSAKQIQKVQQSEFENYDIQLRIKVTMHHRPVPDYLLTF